MSKRKLDTDAEVAEEPVAKKVKEDTDVKNPTPSKFRHNLFDPEEFDKNFSAYSESAP